MFLLLVTFLHYCYAVFIEEQKEATENFKIHKNEHIVIFEMPSAEDATLDSFQNNSYCQVKQQFIQTETLQFTIIQPDDFKEYYFSQNSYEFENDTPLNFRQFIGMVHVNDGMIAITSDAIAYLLKFNYDKVLQGSGFKTYGNGEEFAGVIWKADFQTVMPSLIARSEIPQLVYSKESNLAFVLYSDSGQFFSVADMEQNAKNVYIYQITNWVFREDRGLTKVIDDLLISSVGPAGLDIYKIQDRQVQFYENVQFETLPILLKDFAILREKDGIYKLYLLDENLGLILFYMFVNSSGITFEKIIDIEPVEGGIAVDTKNGKNVFAAFHQNGYYFYIEYLVDFNSKSYSIITRRMSDYSIVDVDATDEFAIISGVNHHQIVYENGYEFIAPHKEKNIFTQIGLRDFEFFKYTYEKEDLEKSQDEYKYDDFFFGVTAGNAFLTKFKFVPARIICYAEHQNDHRQYYTLKYNSTAIVNYEVSSEKIIRTTKTFSVQLVHTFLYDDQLEFVFLMLGILCAFVLVASNS